MSKSNVPRRDHLTGLAGKSYRAPFIYCSAATKQLLLKLERRLHRFNYAKKLVESHEYSYLDYAKRDRILVRDLSSPSSQIRCILTLGTFSERAPAGDTYRN